MYELSKQEEVVLIIMFKNIRINYIKKNKYNFRELPLLEECLCLKDDISDEVENKIDEGVQVEKFEDIFSNKGLYKIVKALAYDEKLVLSLYYVANKTDKQIGEIFSMSRSGANKKRLRIEEKLRKEANKRGIKYV